jgi:acid stress chaperone HdeB
MKYLIAAGLAAAMILNAAPSWAEKLDFSQMKCSDFLALNKDEIGMTLIWVEGFYTAQDSAPVLDTDKIQADGTSLAQYCSDHPDSAFTDAADAVVKIQGEDD